MKKLLPIGSVIKLYGIDRLLMIIGQGHKEIDGNEIFDYCGCLFPEGYQGVNSNILFYDNQIERLFFLGFQNSEQASYISLLSDLMQKTQADLNELDNQNRT